MLIGEGDNIVIYDLKGVKHVVKVTNERSLYINKHLLDLKFLIGTELGNCYEWNGEEWQKTDSLDNDEIKLLFDKNTSFQDIINYYNSEFAGDNRNIKDDNTSQQLTQAEIDVWRNITKGGMDLVKQVASNSASLADKSLFSQQKYINKKKKKYISAFKTMPPSLYDICESYWNKHPGKIGFVRPDYLSYILYSANININTKAMVFDHSMGLLLAGVSQRLFHDNALESSGLIYPLVAKGVSDKILHQGNFIKGKFYPLDLEELLDHLDKNDKESSNKRTRSEDQTATEGSKKKNVLYPTLSIPDDIYINSFIATVSYIKNMDLNLLIDQLIVIADRLLLPGGTLVIFSQHIQPLIKQQAFLTSGGSYVHVKLDELFHREYQVLPRRTHPLMKMDRLCTGFVLSAIKIINAIDNNDN